MRSKLFTTVVTLALVGPFAYFTANEAVNIKQHLHEQHSRIELLNAESLKLDEKLNQTETVKEKTSEELQRLEQEANEILAERQRLEAELGAN